MKTIEFTHRQGISADINGDIWEGSVCMIKASDKDLWDSLVTPENATAAVAGMSWGEYCCDILEGCEEGEEDCIAFDEQVTEDISRLYNEVRMKQVPELEGKLVVIDRVKDGKLLYLKS